MTHGEGCHGHAPVVGYAWVRLATDRWGTAVIRRCPECLNYDIEATHWLDLAHAVCWQCLSQDLEWVGQAEGCDEWHCRACDALVRCREEE